jgi:hypothetical protein
MIVNTLNDIYPDKLKFKISDLKLEKRMEKILEDIVWHKRDSGFDKIKFAQTIAKTIDKKEMIPSIALKIVNQIIQITEERVKLKPRTEPLISLQGPEYTKKILELKKALKNN